MAGCSYCGEMHAPLYICDARRRAAANMVANSPSVVANKHPAVVANRHGKHADLEKRRAYMRDYMKRKRSK